MENIFKNYNNTCPSSGFKEAIALFLAVACSLLIAVLVDISDIKGVGLLVIVTLAPLLFYLVSTKRNVWIPVIFMLMAIRNLNIVDVEGLGGLKIGDVFIGYIFVLWFIQNALRSKPVRFIRSRVDLYIILFLCFYAFALFWTDSLDFGLWRVTKLTRNYIFYLLIRELFIDNFADSYKKMSYSYIITGLIMAIAYVFVLFNGVTLEDIRAIQQNDVLTSQSLGFMREKGTGIELLSNGPAGFLIISSLFAFGLLMFRNTKLVQLTKILVALLILFVATVVLMHRSIMLLAASMLTIMLFGYYKIRFTEGRRALTLIVVIFALLFSMFGINKMISKRFVNPFDDGSWTERMELIGAAWKGFVRSPIVGVGPGGNYTLQLKYADTEPARHVDNLYMTVLSEVGLVGFILLVLIIFSIIGYNYRFLCHDTNDFYLKCTAVLILAYSCSYFGVALIGQEIENFEAWIMLGLTSAIIGLQDQINKGEKEGVIG